MAQLTHLYLNKNQAGDSGLASFANARANGAMLLLHKVRIR
mgnify:CR=1 FL=1